MLGKRWNEISAAKNRGGLKVRERANLRSAAQSSAPEGARSLDFNISARHAVAHRAKSTPRGPRIVR